MDNVTHTLAGLLVAEVVAKHRASPSEPRFLRLALFCSVLANNLPDFDFLLTRLTPGRLGYLLHHRGHTHTVVGALGLGLLVVLGVELWTRRRRFALTRDDRMWLFGLSVAGPYLHVSLDALNSYGVHPFWPFDSHWFYGDTLFILEPLLWAVMVPALFWLTRARTGRFAYGALLACTLILPFASGAVYWPLAAISGAIMLGSFALCMRLSLRARSYFGIGGTLAVIAIFAVAHRVAYARLERRVVELFPAERVRDFVLSPLPDNPVCWTFIVIATGPNESYVLRRGRIALAPGFASLRRCGLLGEVTASETIAFERELVTPLSELRALQRENCNFSALLRFARAPFAIRLSDGSMHIGDFRFARSQNLGFGELTTPEKSSCPPNLPPWIPPRADLFGAP